MLRDDVERILGPLFEVKDCDGWCRYPLTITPTERELAYLLRRLGANIPIGKNLDWVVEINHGVPYLGEMRSHPLMSQEEKNRVIDQFHAWLGAHVRPPEIVDLTDMDERMSQRELDELHPSYDDMARELQEAREAPRRKYEPRS